MQLGFQAHRVVLDLWDYQVLTEVQVLLELLVPWDHLGSLEDQAQLEHLVRSEQPDCKAYLELTVNEDTLDHLVLLVSEDFQVGTEIVKLIDFPKSKVGIENNRVIYLTEFVYKSRQKKLNQLRLLSL